MWRKGIGFALLAFLVCASDGASIRVGSFNVDHFGKMKLSKDHVMATFCQVILEYDLIFIMEIQDLTIMDSFMDKLNNASPEGVIYDITLSKQKGRTSAHKEHCAFISRVDRVKILEMHQFATDREDAFERELNGVLASSIYPDIPVFFMLGLRTHAKPVVPRLNSVEEVFDEAARYFGTRRGLVVGDLRADCHDGRGLSRTSGGVETLSSQFVWAEDASIDAGSCAYDRMIVSQELVKNVLPSKVKVMRFDLEYGLSYKETVEVSNHYPIGLEIGSEIFQQQHLQQHLRKRETAMSARNTAHVLRLASFNIQIFGTAKFAKPEVVEVLSRIVRRYDITLIQEIRDSTQTVIPGFLERINMDAEEEGVAYGVVFSNRLGRSISKEQYAYIYRTGSVELTRALVYNDTEDVFQREPFSVLVRSKLLDIPEFFLLGIHVQPGNVTKELNKLHEVFDQTARFYSTQSGIILGDLNADCSYLTSRAYSMLDLVMDERFTWIINSSVDTTTSTTNCAYDRFIVAGPIMTYIVPGSATPFLYDQSYQLDQELTRNVSDHYPIEMQIQGEPLRSGSSKINCKGCFLLSNALFTLIFTINIFV